MDNNNCSNKNSPPCYSSKKPGKVRQDEGGLKSTGISRRQLMGVASAGTLAAAFPGCEPVSDKNKVGAISSIKPSDWERLATQVEGRLINPVSPIAPCFDRPGSKESDAAMESAKNPFYLEEVAGATQSTGWEGAWRSVPSTYALAAETPQDIAAAVNFAHKHDLRLVVKGTGHDYLGRSCAPDSLLVWTHKMRNTKVHQDFVAQGGEGQGESAITVEAGTRWLEAYKEVTTKNGRYVQGGGCASVGAAGGFIQGGGFGSFSKKFGPGAGSMLEAEVVTADGKICIANAYQHADLYWALRGGGGTTFGIVTKLTLATHQLPKTFGLVRGSISASTDADFKFLIERFIRFYREQLNNEHWGEQFSLKPDNSIGISLLFQGLDAEEVENIWEPLNEWLSARSPQYKIETETIVLPAKEMWNYHYWKAHHPDLVTLDPRPGQADDQYWWTPNQSEVSMYWYTYQSRWIPVSLFESTVQEHFAEVLFQASRHWSLTMHINKGLAGASDEALKRGRQTSINPAVFESAALMILAAGKRGVFPGVKGHSPDPVEAKEKIAQVNAAMNIIRHETPGSGAYANEADYFEEDWQSSFWGTNYPRLLAIKQKYDPSNLFRSHHGVGSEDYE